MYSLNMMLKSLDRGEGLPTALIMTLEGPDPCVLSLMIGHVASGTSISTPATCTETDLVQTMFPLCQAGPPVPSLR